MNNKQIINDMTEFEYILAFNKDRTQLSDRNVQKSAKRGRMFCLKESDTYLGFICTVYEYNKEIITYAYTKEQFRKRGVFTSLAEYVFNTSKKNVELWILENHPYYQIVDSCLKRIECFEFESFHIFTLENPEYSAWQQFKKENYLEECCEWFKRNGYQIYSFAEADELYIEQVKNSHNSEFQNKLNPYVFFENYDINPLAEMSSLVVRDDKLVAYALYFKSTNNGVILQQIATSSDTKNSGAIMLALTASCDSFLKNNYSKCTFGIHPSNIESNSIKRMFEKYFSISEKVMKKYVKFK